MTLTNPLNPAAVGPIFVAVMVLVGGGFAMLGDSVGRTVGKKRIKISRIRPKHTAMLFTFFSGALGTGVAIGLMYWLVQPVRVWIQEGNSVQVKLHKAQSDLAGVKKEVDEAGKQLTDAQGQLVVKNQELTTANQQKDDALKQKKDAETSANSAKLEADKARGDANKARADADKVKRDISTTEAKLKDTNAKLMETSAKLEAAKKEQETITKDNQGLTQQNLKLTDQIRSLQEEQKNLQGASNSLQVELNRLNQDKVDIQERLADSQSRLKQAIEDVKAASDKLASVRSLLNLATVPPRFLPIVMRINDELARSPIISGASPGEIRIQVDGLLKAASTFLRSRSGDDVTHEAKIAPRETSTGSISVEDQISSVIQVTQRSHEPMLLIARAAVNSFKGEDALVSVETYPNRVVYAAGQVMFEGRVDGALTKAQIVQQLTSLILTGLRSKVIADGVIPATGQDSELGEITSEQILEIAEQLKAFGRKARVQFVSKAPTRRGDKLKIEYRLRP